MYGSNISSVSYETLKPLVGLTVEIVAAQKRLQLRFLQEEFGLSDVNVKGIPRVKIPYHDPDGNIVAVRYRLYMGPGGFLWRKGDHPSLYGLERLAQIGKAGYCLLVEGESDTWTGWFHNIPTLGIPGKSIWRPEWAEYLKDLLVYLWQEPSAEDLTARVGATIPNLQVIPAPSESKDISEAHIAGQDIGKLLVELRRNSMSWALILEKEAQSQEQALRKAAHDVLYSTDPLALVEEAIKQNGAGNTKPAIIVYLSCTSRLLAMRLGAMPVHIILVGPSSAGKSYTLQVIVLPLLPKDAYHVIDAGSPRVLIYETDELRHKVIIFGEVDSLPSSEDNPAASAIRNLLQDHCLHYKVVVRDEEAGNYRVHEVDKPGPTVLVTTSTRRLGGQMGTRVFTIHVPHDREQLKAILKKQGGLEIEGINLGNEQLVAYQAYLQFKAPWDVIVPFAPQLADLIGRSAEAPRISRDYARILSLVKAVAILRFMHRERDGSGRLIATLGDYEYVRLLVNDVYVESTTGVSEGIKKVVGAVTELTQCQDQAVQVKDIQQHLGATKTEVYRWVKAALEGYWLVNNESRKYHPYKLQCGDPLPASNGLPTVEDLKSLKPLLQPLAKAIETNAEDACEPMSGFTVSPKTDDILKPNTLKNRVVI